MLKALLFQISAVFFLCMFPVFGACSQSPDYADIFGSDYKDASAFMYKNQGRFKEALGEEHYKMAMAVVFPEQIRYKLLLDFFETQALLQIYVEEGTEAADFSIGSFQMKPSFAEALETYCTDKSGFSNSAVTKFKAEGITAVRRERVKRLQDLDWQLIYLSTFVKVVYHRFPHLKNCSDTDCVGFLAAAYNTGFSKTRKQIEDAAKLSIFPYGKMLGNEQHNYTDIAEYFYKTISNP